VCALTFDDGPDPEFTPKILDILRSFGITATFNVMGWNALHHTALLKDVIGAGHEIGNHSWSHKDLSTTSDDDTRHEIVYGNEVIEHLSGIKLNYFRPPRGELTGAAVRITAELGLDILLWSLSGSVPGVERPQQVRDFVLSKLAPGHIIDFHDGIGRGTFDRTSPTARGLIQRRSAELVALPQIIGTALHRGYTFVTVTELLAHEQRTV
jgi:peptidoglycan/xylan/chitin deacetylase (PgdA/CDA1 family)